MNEIYWITRLDAINTVCWLTFGILLVYLIIIVLLRLIFCDSYVYKEETEGISKIWKKSKTPTMIILFISLLIGIFVPTKREAFEIWGLGKTIDYIQNNEDIQKLPDKTVKVLDMWADEMLEKVSPKESEEE